jgi:mycoredoxin
MNMTDLYSRTPSQIVMYSTQTCSDCFRVRAFFEANKIPFLHVLLEDNREATEFVVSMNKGYQSVPTIIFPDGSILVEPTWQDLVEKASQ